LNLTPPLLDPVLLPADTTALLLLRMISQNSMQMQQSAIGGLGTQNPSSTFGTLPLLGNMSSSPGTTATGGGAQNVPTPTYNSKALATLLKNNILNIEQVGSTCKSQGIDVNDVCSAAFDHPTPRTRGTPRSALRPAGGSSRAHLLPLSFRAWAPVMMTRSLLKRPH
jgi:hypothetical protein